MSLAYVLPFSGNAILDDGFEFHGDTYLSVTPGGEPATLRQMTFSAWVRFSSWPVSATRTLLSAWTDINNRFHIRMNNSRVVEMVMVAGGAVPLNLQSPAGAINDNDWHHIVCMLDLDQAVAADRAKIWIDNVEPTYGYAVYPSQGTDFTALLETSVPHYIGQNGNSGDYHSGVIGDLNVVAEQALDPSSFGETVDGVWVWKSYAGTHGTYGHRLRFNDSGDIGANSAVA